MSLFFGREVELRVEGSEQILSQKGLRTTFQISRESKDSLDSGNISVYNFSKSTLGILENGAKLSLYAGYTGKGGSELLISGDVEEIITVPARGDQITEIQISDGSKNVKEGRISQSWSGKTSAKQIIQDIALSIGMDVQFGSEIVDKSYQSGFVGYGSALNEIKTVCSRIGAVWGIQNGVLNILGKNEYSLGVITVSPSTGLIGKPEKKFEKGKEVGVKLETLLLPELLPRKKLNFSSPSMEGTIKITKLMHSGDTHGDNWKTTVEGEKV